MLHTSQKSFVAAGELLHAGIDGVPTAGYGSTGTFFDSIVTDFGIVVGLNAIPKTFACLAFTNDTIGSNGDKRKAQQLVFGS